MRTACLLAVALASASCADGSGGARCLPYEEDGAASRGRTEAAVLIEEFGDFECPYCGAVQGTLRELDVRYPDHLRFVFRHYPLDFHAHAAGAARAAFAAQQQDQFWAYHDLLFANAERLGADDLAGYAAQIGLDAARFAADRDGEDADAAIGRDIARGRRLGVEGVPTFFVNGRRVTGAASVIAFADVIDAELRKAATLFDEGVPPERLARELSERNCGDH